MVLRGRRINNFVDFSFKLEPYISYKFQRMASTASEREGAKYHRKIEFLMINPTRLSRWLRPRKTLSI
jgi:hypothetical protein